MPALHLIKVLGLLASARENGIQLLYANDKLLVKYNRKLSVNRELLAEIQESKSQLIEYFTYYDDDFSEGPPPPPQVGSLAYYGALSGGSPGTLVSRDHLLQLTQTSERLPLFIIPGIGGRSGGYRILGEHLGEMFSVYGIEMMEHFPMKRHSRPWQKLRGNILYG